MSVTNWAREILDLDIALTRTELWLAEYRCEQVARGHSARQSFRKYNPNQPRVPAGRPDGGQWTDGGSSEAGGGGSLGDWFNTWLGGGLGEGFSPDLIPDQGDVPSEEQGEWPTAAEELSEPLIHQTSNKPRSGSLIWPNATPAQLGRLTASDLQAQTAIRRVQEMDARWRPGSSIYEGIEGAITTNRWIVQQAEARLRELQSVGIGPGPFASEWLPARGAERNFYASERRDMNRIGSAFGCHTCGTTTPGTTSRNFILDHQIPSALNHLGKTQLLYPHCLSCSLRQGGAISRILGAR